MLFLRAAALPYVLAGLALVAAFAQHTFLASQVDHLVSIAKSSSGATKFFLFAVFAFCETLFPFSHYVAGTLLFVALFGASQASLEITLPAYLLGVTAGLWTNYALAHQISKLKPTRRFEPLITRGQQWAARYGFIADALSSIHPNHAGLLAFCYGLTRTQFIVHFGVILLASAAVAAVVLTAFASFLEDAAVSGVALQLWIAFILFAVGTAFGLRALSTQKVG